MIKGIRSFTWIGLAITECNKSSYNQQEVIHFAAAHGAVLVAFPGLSEGCKLQREWLSLTFGHLSKGETKNETMVTIVLNFI